MKNKTDKQILKEILKDNKDLHQYMDDNKITDHETRYSLFSMFADGQGLMNMETGKWIVKPKTPREVSIFLNAQV